MGKIFYVMGKSASGKDTIFKRLCSRLSGYRTVKMYTTRPIRDGEHNGVEYFFVDQTFLEETRKNGITKTALIVVGDFLGENYERSKLYDPAFTTEFRQGTEAGQ